MPDQPGSEWWQQASGRSGRIGQPPSSPHPSVDHQAQPPQASAQSSSAGDQSSTAGQNRPWRKKYRAAIILAAIGLLLFLATVWLYPSATQLPVPPASTLAIEASQPVGIIQYEVDQLSSTIAEMKVTVQLPVDAPLPPAGTTTVELVVSPPIGVSFETCPASTCVSEPSGVTSEKVLLAFKPLSNANGETGISFADFLVRAHNLGGTYNDVNASVVAPAVIYHGSGTPTLLTQYNIPDASSYDWSVFPVEFANATFATWNEPVTGGQISARVADGVDYANQSKDNYHTFLAGVILGAAVGAGLASLQEVLHANDPK
jgi:hypothetical protein